MPQSLAPAAPPALAPLAAVPPALAPPALAVPPVLPPECPPATSPPPALAPPLLPPPLLAPAAVAPAVPESVPPVAAPALPPSLEELEQPRHSVRLAKPRETLLLAESRCAGFMARSVSCARVASAMSIQSQLLLREPRHCHFRRLLRLLARSGGRVGHAGRAPRRGARFLPLGTERSWSCEAVSTPTLRVVVLSARIRCSKKEELAAAFAFAKSAFERCKSSSSVVSSAP
jgi:hypothetical protein